MHISTLSWPSSTNQQPFVVRAVAGLSAWLTSSACMAAAQPWDIIFGEADTSQISLNFSLRRDSMEHRARVRLRSHAADNP